MAWTPDGRLLVSQRTGAVRVVRDDVLQARPWITIPDVRTSDDAGLTGLAVDPAFAANHYVYLYYSALPATPDQRPTGVLIRVQDRGGIGVDPTRLLADVPGPADASNMGGVLRFGPDGFLYLATGDSGDRAAATDPSDLRGKLLRLDRTGAPAPNLSLLQLPAADRRVFALGLTQPTGIAFDSSGLPLVSQPDGVLLVRSGTVAPPGNGAAAATPGSPSARIVLRLSPAAAGTGVAAYGSGPLSAFHGAIFTCTASDQRLRLVAVAPVDAAGARSNALAPNCSADVERGPDGFLYFLDGTHGRIFRIRS